MKAVSSAALPILHRNRKRFEQVIRTLAKYGLADWVRDWNPDLVKRQFRSGEGEDVRDMAPGVRLRMALTELGTTYIKLGQMMSSRSDVIDAEIAAELSQLQSGTPADEPDYVRETIESELGQPAEQLFATFDDVPMASASIGQVHAATLHDGQAVVVKIQHRGIDETVRADLEILTALAKIAEDYSRELRLFQPRALTAEFRRSLLGELDFKREERNLLEFARNFEDDPSVHFPRAYPEFSTQRVLTMERIDGFSIADSEQMGRADVDSKEIAKRGANAYLEMIFRDGFYHADPHPGNIFVLSGNVVGFLDSGMVGRLDERTRDDFANLLMAAAEKDTDELCEALLRIGSAPANLDRDALRTEISQFAGDFMGGTLTDFDLGETIDRGSEIVRSHRIVLRPAISLLIKALVLLEGSSRLLDREFNLAGLMEPYCVKIVERRFAPKSIWHRAQRSYREWDRLLGMLPRELTEILTRVQKGTFDVNLEHRRLEATTNRLVYGIIAAALFLGSSLLWSMGTPPLWRGVSLIGVLGVVVSVILGVRLVRAVAKSGGLRRRE